MEKIVEKISLKDDEYLNKCLEEFNMTMKDVIKNIEDESFWECRHRIRLGLREHLADLIEHNKLITDKNNKIIVGQNSNDMFDYVLTLLGSAEKVLEVIKSDGHYDVDDYALCVSKHCIRTEEIPDIFDTLNEKDFFALVENTFTFE